MNNTHEINDAAAQLIQAVETFRSLTRGMEATNTEQGNAPLRDLYSELRMDELEHIQQLILVLTELVSEEYADKAENEDEAGGSAFAAGDLNAVKGEVTGEESKEVRHGSAAH